MTGCLTCPALAGRWLDTPLGLYVFLALGHPSRVLELTSGLARLERATCYIGFRVWSVPDIGPIAPPSAWNDASRILTLPGRNAAELYREAGRSVVQLTDPQAFLSRNQAALDLIRRAAALEDCRFGRT